jgi:predicted transcriptional regulator of viral defense system
MNYLQFNTTFRDYPGVSIRDIHKAYPGFDNRRLVEWQHKGYIQKLRNGYYRFTDRHVSEGLLHFWANKLYKPSYVSLESALSMYGFIPEGVFQVTSCTTLKTNRFDTPEGTFVYRNVKPSLFFGYTLHSWQNYRYAIATPEKTILDYLYLHSELKQSDDFDALRWNPSALIDRLDTQKMNEYLSHMASPALHSRLNLLYAYLNANT